MNRVPKIINHYLLNPIIMISNISILVLSILNIFMHRSLTISICCILIECFSLVLNCIYEKVTDKLIFKKTKKEYVQVLSKSETRIQKSRLQLRHGLNIITTVAIIIIFCLSVLYKTPLKFIAGVCIIAIAYIYADYLPSVKTNYEYYDSLTIKNNEKPSAIRGLAKIYKEEYELTQFNRKKYAEIHKIEFDNNLEHQSECIKSILYMKGDSIKHPTLILSIITIFFNIILVMPTIPDYAFSYILKIPANDFAITIVLLVFNVLFFSVNLRSHFEYKEECKTVKTICDMYVSNDNKMKYDTCETILDETNNSSIVKLRGVFVYCSTLMDKGIDLNIVPIQYRMLFIHRYDDNKERFIWTVLLSISAIFALLWDYNVKISTIFLIILPLIIISVIYYFTGLKNIGKRKIVKAIKELEAKNKE